MPRRMEGSMLLPAALFATISLCLSSPPPQCPAPRGSVLGAQDARRGAGLSLRDPNVALGLRLRGGSSFGDDNIVFDPARMASIGIGVTKDKVGNHIVTKLAPGWPAALSDLVQVNDILLEVDSQPIGHLTTNGLVQLLRGPEGSEVAILLLLRVTAPGSYGSEVAILLQRGPQADLIDVLLPRALQAEGPAPPPTPAQG
ncbi:hypothetical protein T484DRAFT_1776345 [Baffinella frigidus]|nr:hypothetical protein T484DRAFT_1776345 [Cryptophyta sp. CCMP2293]